MSCCLFADMINKQDCKYGDNCTFAYHQEEIDVWTEERKGTLNRDLLFHPLGGVKRGSLTIAKLLKEHQGIFTFLCEVPPPPRHRCTDRAGEGLPAPPCVSALGPRVWGPSFRIGKSLRCQKDRPTGSHPTAAWIPSSPLILRRWKPRPEREVAAPALCFWPS